MKVALVAALWLGGCAAPSTLAGPPPASIEYFNARSERTGSAMVYPGGTVDYFNVKSQRVGSGRMR